MLHFRRSFALPLALAALAIAALASANGPATSVAALLGGVAIIVLLAMRYRDEAATHDHPVSIDCAPLALSNEYERLRAPGYPLALVLVEGASLPLVRAVAAAANPGSITMPGRDKAVTAILLAGAEERGARAFVDQLTLASGRPLRAAFSWSLGDSGLDGLYHVAMESLALAPSPGAGQAIPFARAS